MRFFFFILRVLLSPCVFIYRTLINYNKIYRRPSNDIITVHLYRHRRKQLVMGRRLITSMTVVNSLLKILHIYNIFLRLYNNTEKASLECSISNSSFSLNTVCKYMMNIYLSRTQNPQECDLLHVKHLMYNSATVVVSNRLRYF